MVDKFGKEADKDLKNLVFKSVGMDDEGNILFNAEEYFVTEGIQDDGAGNRFRVERFHYNDIICAKLGADGKMVWARNINKTEVTQNDGAYASYSAYIKDGKTYFFVCSAAENPQKIGKERLLFKQGYGKTRNVFAIVLDEKGHLDYEKVIDGKEALTANGF